LKRKEESINYMERENFLYKINGVFRFNTGDEDNGIVTQKLGIEPVCCWSWYDIWRLSACRRRKS